MAALSARMFVWSAMSLIRGHDIADFLGRFTQTLDPLRGFLNLLTDRIHTLDRALHLGAFVGDCHGPISNDSGFGSVCGHLVNRDGHFVHSGEAPAISRLMFGRFGEVHGGGLCFLRGRRHLHGGLINGGYQLTQLVDRVVDGVGDRPGEVFRHRCLNSQVAISEVTELVKKTQNRGLVTLVFQFHFLSTIGFSAFSASARSRS